MGYTGMSEPLTTQYLQAYSNAFACAVATWQPAAPVFYNGVQSALVFCPDGSPFYFTVSAGLFPALTQEEADDIAQSYAFEQAEIHAICLSSIPSTAVLGVFYSATIVATGTSLAVAPASDVWALVAGALPPGLTLNNGGFISGMARITGGRCPVIGVPAATGVYSFTIRVMDPVGDLMQKTYTITVN